jgi:O-antigen/teichoic acid export membrane protein
VTESAFGRACHGVDACEMSGKPAPPQIPIVEADPALAEVADRPGHRAVFARMGRNVGWLLGGRGFQAVASLAYLAAAAHGLGPAGFGVFTLILTYGQGIANLAQFQSWQAVIRYGSIHLADGQEGRLARLLGFTATVDIASALIGAGLAVACSHAMTLAMGWDPAQQTRTALFGGALLLSIGGTPSGMLRLHDRFGQLAFCEAVGPLVRLIGSVVAFASHGSLDAYLAVWASAALLQSAMQWVVALYLPGQRPILGRTAFREAVAENRRLWRFMIQTNLSASLSLIWTQIGTLAVGGVAGATAAGGFRLAARLAKALAKPVQSATRVLYPELAKLVASEDHRTLSSVTRRVSLVALGLGLVVVAIAAVAGRHILTAFAGPGFAFAYLYLLLFAVASAIDLSGFALEPLHTAFGKAGRVLGARAIGAIVYIVALVVLLPSLGPIGAILSAIVSSIVMRLRLAVSARPLLARG